LYSLKPKIIPANNPTIMHPTKRLDNTSLGGV